MQVVDRESTNTYALEKVYSFNKLEVAFEQQFYNASYMSLVSGFEEFLRQTLISRIIKEAKSVSCFEDLGEEVHNLHMVATGHLLAKRHKPPQQLKRIDLYDVCSKLGTCVPKSPSFCLNAEAIAVLKPQLDIDNYFSVLNKFKCGISWSKLGGAENIKKYFNVSRSCDAKKNLIAFYADMVRHRNRIAHTGASADIEEQRLVDHIELLSIFAEEICLILGSTV